MQIQKTITRTDKNQNTLSFYPAAVQSRAMCITPRGSVWFVNSLGQIGWIENKKLQWLKYIKASEKLDLRSIAVLGEDTILVANAGSPAYIFQSIDKGKTWEIKYTDKRPEAFIDAIMFSDKNFGYAWLDPMGDCYTPLYTQDAGKTWKDMGCIYFPKPMPGEAAFAASNSIIALYDDILCAATGGMAARLIMENNESNENVAMPTPIQQGSQMQGIFSMDISKTAQPTIVIAGGNYENQSSGENTIAISHDKGKSWKVLNTPTGPTFISCVKFHPSDDKVILAAGKGLYITYDQGTTWDKIMDGDFNTLAISPDGKEVWYTLLK